MDYSLIIIFFIILLVLFIIYLWKNAQILKNETFIANSNKLNPIINFDYLSNPNYGNDAINKYYINTDTKWIWGRRKYGTVPHQWTYKNTDNGLDYYYGQLYNKQWSIPFSNYLYNTTGVRY
jgi:hypothetical protein